MKAVEYQNLDVERGIEQAKKDGLSIEQFPDDLLKNRDIILEAVKQNGIALAYAPLEFKKDKEVVASAAISNVYSLSYASDLLKQNKDYMFETILPILQNKYHLGNEEVSIRDLVESKYKMTTLPSFYSNLFKESENKIGDIKEIMELYYHQGIYTHDFLEQLPEAIKKKMKKGSHLNDILHLLEYYFHSKKSNYELELEKLQKLMKKGFVPSATVFHKIPHTKVDEFDKQKWFSLAGYPLFQGCNEAKAALVEMMFVFGLFEKSEESHKRMEMMKKIINHIPGSFRVEELDDMESRGVNTDTILKCYKKVRKGFYKINTENYPDFQIMCNLPNQVEEGSLKSRFFNLNTGKIKSHLSKSDYEVLLKHVENFYSKEWLERVCTYVEEERYELSFKPTVEEQEIIAEAFTMINNRNTWNAHKLSKMFQGVKMEYNPRLYAFFIQNYMDILKEEDYQKLFPMMINQFDEVSHYYQKMAGKVTLDGFKTYANGVQYIDIPHGYQEFALLCNRSGVTEPRFHKLVAILEKQRMRKLSTIPSVEVETDLEINGKQHKVYGEIKRLDDPIALVIGEEKLSNCCQVLGKKGEPCMVHLATDKTGRLFCVYDQEHRLLAQSWVWRNGDTICFDNVERSKLLFEEEAVYKDAIFKIYERAAHAFVEESKKKIATILSEKVDILSPFDYKVLQTKLEKTRVRHVTVGDTRYGFVMNRAFKERMPMPKMPLNYGAFDYVDSDSQVIIYSDKTGYSRETEVLEEYLDKRLIQSVKGKDISSDMIYKIKCINHNYDNIRDVIEMEKLYQTNYKNIELILGEDWYLLYEERVGNIIIYSMMGDLSCIDSLIEQIHALTELQNNYIDVQVSNYCTISNQYILLESSMLETLEKEKILTRTNMSIS